MKRRYTEHDPIIQSLADEICRHWNTVRGGLLGRQYVASSRHRKSFIKAALLIVGTIPAEEYVRSLLSSHVDVTRCHPSLLGSEVAVARYWKLIEKSKGVDIAFYKSQISLVDSIHENGFSWEDILLGNFRLSPLTLWVVCTLNNMDPEPYRVDAIVELRKCPAARDILGDVLEGLQCP